MRKEMIIIIGVIITVLILAGIISFLVGGRFKDYQTTDEIVRKSVKIQNSKSPANIIKTASSSPTISARKKSPSLPVPKLSPSPQNSVTNISPKISGVIRKPTTDPIKRSVPAYMKEYTGSSRINPQKGKISFSVNADWIEGEGDRLLFIGNYDGDTKKSLFEIIGIRDLLIFETYDDAEGLSNSADAPDANLGKDYYGKDFDIQVIWDFTGEKKYKQIYINGKLGVEVEVEGPAVKINPKIYTGNIKNLVIE